MSFTHLNTSNGLSDNNVKCMAVDRNGFLWIGTADGLNSYDGYAVKTYSKEHYSQLASNNVIHLTCDSRNRLWLGTQEGITWLDERRNFHRVALEDSITVFASRTILETKSFGDILFTSKGQYYFDSVRSSWTRLDWISEELKYARFLDADVFDPDKIIYSTYRGVYILDYAEKKFSFQRAYTQHPVSVCRVDENSIAVGLMNGVVEIVDTRNNTVMKEYKLTNIENGKSLNTSLTEVRRSSNGDILVATGYAGLVIIDKSGNVTRHKHDPINSRSIAANNTYRTLGGSQGEVIVGTSSSGLSIGNVNRKQAGYKKVFSDREGNLFDNYITEIVAANRNVLWMGSYDRLIRWDRTTDRARFYHYYFQRPDYLKSLEIRTLCIDKKGRVWVSPTFDGVAVLNELSGSFTKIKQDTSKGLALKTTVVNDLLAASDNKIWVGTPLGIYTIDANTLKTDAFSDHPVLSKMSGKKIVSLFEDGYRNIWMGTSDEGVYCFNSGRNTLVHYSARKGLVSDHGYSFLQDQQGNMYVAAPVGFSVISPEGKIDTYTTKNGLRYEKCEGFLEDNHGMIWVANNKCLIRFDPLKKMMRYYDEQTGLSAAGFFPGGSVKTEDGELVWGSRGGLNFFYPGQLAPHRTALNVNIYQADIRDSIIHTASNYAVSLPHSRNTIVFHFTAIDLMGSKNIRYRYMLQGYDKDWQEGIDIRHARYASLPAGNYSFLVKATRGENTWTAAQNKIAVTIIPPLWQRWWFVSSVIALVIGLIYWIVAGRNAKFREQREEIETEQAISYFASSMSEHQTEENILWDVVKNCIGRLHFEDCVIYLLDKEKNMLVQKAAHGPKNPVDFEINRPIDIALGKGIVGSVAASGKAEIIGDTTRDSRYIVDDKPRFSEITVPLVYNGRVLGVIDCEHSKKRFFTQRHLSILTTIASLCANKIIRARAEEERRKAQYILTSTQQKMNEIEMQALRAQMNPHFIFNCLNSINRYIVKSDQTTASLYLTKFAKLIRLILDNSNSKNVTLSNELEALKLYIEMEALRFDKKFTYEIIVADNIGADTIELPPLIIQPYVENAIWHGLLHKDVNGHLSIRISMSGPSILQCVIEDNGIGREKARMLKSKTATSRKSLGMQLTESRLSLLNKHAELNASVEIVDLENGNAEAAGTKVVLKIPV